MIQLFFFIVFGTVAGFRPLPSMRKSGISTKIRTMLDVSDGENGNITPIATKVMNYGDDSSKNRLLLSGFEDRSEVNSLILQLEKKNPKMTGAVTSAEFIGSWYVLFSGSLTDPGLLLYQVAKALPFSQINFGDLEITISGSMKATSKCSAMIAGKSVDIEVETALDAYGEDGMRFKETYVSGTVGDLNIPFPAPLFSSFSRDLIITYLDNDVMIVRDQFGCPDILQKRENQIIPLSTTDYGLNAGEESPGASS